MKLTGIEALRQTAANLHEKACGIRNAAEAESRDLTAEERTQIEGLTSQFDSTMADINAREKLDAQAALLATPQPRIVAPEASHRPVITPVADAGTHGFRHSGEFFRAVMNAKNGSVDPRLARNAVSYAGEGTNADGGYALPPDFRANILQVLMGQESLFAKFDGITTSSNMVTMPVDETLPWSSTGITVGDINEGAAYGDSKPVLKQLQISVAKKGGIVYVSEELLEDVALIGGYVQNKSSEKLLWSLNTLAFTTVIGAGSKITVAKTGGAAAGSAPDLANLKAMLVKVPQTWRSKAVWLMNPNLETAFDGFVVGNFPAYLPPGGISQAPYATLFGRPVIYTELASAVGTEGDIVLVDPTQFFGVTKAGGVKSDVSIHFAFDTGLTAFRVSVRAGAKSKWSAALVRPDTTTCSNVVTLATRA